MISVWEINVWIEVISGSGFGIFGNEEDVRYCNFFCLEICICKYGMFS